jgi:osomolarity two-component system, response regulator SKN7
MSTYSGPEPMSYAPVGLGAIGIGHPMGGGGGPGGGPGGDGGGYDGRINPLHGMGLTDDQYHSILQNMMSGENFIGDGGGGIGDRMKRGLDEEEGGPGPSGSGGGGKRGRFEVVE